MKNKSQSQLEKLSNVLKTPKQYFASKMQNHLSNKIGYLSKLPYVSIPVHVELLYIAKKMPETFLINDIINFLTNIVEDRSKEMPKALATTLFMIFGQVYRNQPRPPLIMAKLLFRDVMEAQEFCHFEKALEFIHRVQLIYFFQPSLLNMETRLALYHQYKPAAEEVPDNYFQWDSELASSLSQVQRNVNSEIMSIRDHPKDIHYASLLVFFMTMPEGQDTFISEFDYLCSAFPQFIPSMFNSVQFFLTHANASDTFASEFVKQFAQLNPTICVDEYQDTLTKIVNVNQQYFPIISGAKLSFNFKKDDINMSQGVGLSSTKSDTSALPAIPVQMSSSSLPYARSNSQQVTVNSMISSVGGRNAADPTVQFLIQSIFGSTDESYSENFSENLKILEEQYSQTSPPLNYTCDILSKFLGQITSENLTIEIISRIISIFDTFFKYTNFTAFLQQSQKKQQQQQQKPPQICELISLFVTKIAKTKFLKSISKSLTNIIVPKPLKNEGLPFKQETLSPFTSKSELHQIAYTMIYAAAKYQIKHYSIVPVVLGPSDPIITRNISGLCESPYFIIASKAFALACLLIVISPDDIGAKIYEKNTKTFHLFLRKFLGRKNEAEELLEDIDLNEPVENQEDMQKLISKLAKLKYLSYEPLLNCRKPNYLDDLLTNEEKFSSTPKYITSRISRETIESISFIGLTKYIFISLISISKSRNNLTVSEIYRQEKAHEWVELLLQKHFSPQERADMLLYYAKNLEKKERWLRVSAYVMILILNAEIINGNMNRISSNIGFDSSSDIVSRENSSVSISNSTTTATSVRVPISTLGSASSSISAPSGSFIVFKFDLPDNNDTVGIISRSLYIDNEVEIAKAFVQFLDHSQYSGNALDEFVEKRPLLANCLQEPSLSKLLKLKVSYDISYKPEFDYPDFHSCLSLNPVRNQRFEYHDAQTKHQILNDLSVLPTDDDLTVIDSKIVIDNITNESKKDLNNQTEEEEELNDLSFIDNFECINGSSNNDNSSALNPFESTQIEREVYRYEMILYSGKEGSMKTEFYEDYTQWFALASLKRYVLSNNEAFLLYAKPTLNILYSEISHANFLTKIMMNRFISLLSICYIKLIHQRNILNEKEKEFLNQSLIPNLEKIICSNQIEQYNALPPIVPALIDSILSNFKISTKSNFDILNHGGLDSQNTKGGNINNNGISSFRMPNGIPLEMVVEYQDMISKIQQSLIITTDEYASKWLLKFAIQSPSLIIQNKNNLQENVIIPLILSSNKDAVVDFFRLIKEKYPEETQNLMDSVAKIVNSVYNCTNK